MNDCPSLDFCKLLSIALGWFCPKKDIYVLPLDGYVPNKDIVVQYFDLIINLQFISLLYLTLEVVNTNAMGIIEKKKNVCLLDSLTTHIVLSGKNFFSSLTLCKADVHAISDLVEITNNFKMP